ncbi:CNH domain-containing protein [Gilbertella persicaria]|uniref:CNH domain-containing protein n=1 Tax=Gilbertella persicaria TaxID=101096 RepID=UPI0022201263|nr:CNH domain-containing protein [Gilbertella persicaria]KAI8098132.1 CNH domain-containing protein [Gilbertella persicaria]
MSHQQYHPQYYEEDNRTNAQNEVDAMLNSLVGQPQQGYYQNNGYQQPNYYYYPQNTPTPTPALPARTEANGYIKNTTADDSNKYYYPPQENNHYGYPPPPVNPHYYPPSNNTPLPQRVSSMNDTYAAQNMPMPVPQLPQHRRQPSGNSDIFRYHHQRNPSQGTPPGSPNHQHMFPQPQMYPPAGYPDATQELINSSYRPTIQHQTSDVSTPSTASSSTPVGFVRPPAPMQPPKRGQSSLRSNMIMTIERPRYDYLPENATEDGEVPFIPVSPDTDSDEEEYFSGHRVNEYSPTTQTHSSPPPPVVVPAPTEVQVMKPVLQPVPQQEQAQKQAQEEKPEEPNYGLISVLSVAFMRAVKGLENVRELWCASEYNESFTGSEAVTIIKNLLKEQVPDEYCILVCNTLMRSQPPLFSPTQYSQKSLISNSVNADDTYYLEEDVSVDNVPTGVLPSLTPCYSYACQPGMGGCYSESCPNVGKDFIIEKTDETTVQQDTTKTSISSPAGGWLVSHEAWSARMDREFLKALDKKEIGRQEVLNETIYSEEKYLADLTILHEVVVKGIEQSGVIEADRVGAFIQTVFNNYQELLQMSDSMFKDMLARYRQYEGQCVPTIGDILVQHMQFFEEAYVKYSPHALLAKYLAEAEIKNNPEFDKFCKELAKHDRTNRLPIWHYLLSPVTRMQRYPLLIEALLKKTPEDHPDHVFLTRSYDIIRSVATKADNTATNIKKRLAILHIRDSISFKQGETYDLQLNDPNRRLYHKGTLKRRSGSLDVADKNDIYAFVFDHMLLMTKLRKTNTGEEYRLWKKPIPLQMLVVQNNPSSSVKYQASGTSSSYTLPQTSSGTTLTLHHLGSRGGAVYSFFCSSVEEKQTWVKAIDDAKVTLKKRHGDSEVFELRPLDDINFRNTGSGPSTGTTTRINCSVPFISQTGEKKIAIGTENGVFFKTEGQDHSVRRIIQCESVLQMAVIEKFHILVVLTEKALKAYPIDTLDSRTNPRAIDRQEVEIAQHVNFFQVGFCNGRDMLVFKKKKNTTSVFTALEPFCDLRDPKNEKHLTHRPSIFSNRPDYLRWFKKYKDFYVGAEASNIHFLKAKLNIVCERGFEVIDPENLTVGRDIPDSEDPEFYFVTRHTEPLKPLAMYRINDKFLLCYDRFAFYVNNRNGSLVPRPDKRKPATICDWEGTPSHIVYEHPYIIAIDPYFIEIRHVDNGELVQIISGENIRLAYYNGGGERPVIHVCMSHSQKPDTQALFHLVLSNHRNSAGYPRR